MRKYTFAFGLVFVAGMLAAQRFEVIPTELLNSARPIIFRQILPTAKGTVLMANNLTQLAESDKMQLSVTWATGYPINEDGKPAVPSGRSDAFNDLFRLQTGIKFITEGPGHIIYFVTDNNHIGLIHYRMGRNAFALPPFTFPVHPNQRVEIKSIWADSKGDLFVGTNNDTVYRFKNACDVTKPEDAAKVTTLNDGKIGMPNYTTSFDNDSNVIVTKGAKEVIKIFVSKGIIPTCYFEDFDSDGILNIGTNKGLFAYEKSTNRIRHALEPPDNGPFTITRIFSKKYSAFMWISTLERGMVRLSTGFGNSMRAYPYKKSKDGKSINPVATFCPKSRNEFFVAPVDSFPAIFNMETGQYEFMSDTSFNGLKPTTTDIKLDAIGNLYVIIDDQLAIAKRIVDDPAYAEVKMDSTISQVVITDVMIRGKSWLEFNNYEIFNIVNWKNTQHDIGIIYNARGFNSIDKLEFMWTLEGYQSEWEVAPYSMMDERMNMATFSRLEPGKYIFRVRVRKAGENWRKPEGTLIINIKPPFWQTWWFWPSIIAALITLIYIIVRIRVRVARKQERIKAAHEKELIELEARALRAQMNPHFIFNCLNSIKSLIQDDQKDKSISYLTTFSKLIRTLFNNADRKEITLYDEIETCKLYLQLEAMRFDTKFSYSVNVDERIDLKSIYIPALVIQPFIENAIWHGIVPRNTGGHVSLDIVKQNGLVDIIIDDNGIGRESSRQNNSASGLTHQSRGVNLTQSRLELDNLLGQRKAQLVVIDKKDESGGASGTRVIIKIHEERA